jgi:tetratricopeptide (TPR) repeat protein
MGSVGKSIVDLLVALMIGLVLAAGCGATPAPAPQQPGDGTGAAAPANATADLVVEMPKVELKGASFRPEALVRPPMPVAEGRKKLTIEKQRAALAKAKEAEEREGLSQILASSLFQASKAETGGKEKPLLEEGRQVLRDALSGAGDKPDANTLRMLGVYEFMLGDYAAAAPVWERLIALNPADAAIDHFRTWWIYSLLLSDQNPEAFAAVQGLTPSLKEFELAYVIAWAKYRAGDGQGAWQAIRAAAIGWPDKPKLKGSVIERDLVLFAGRTPVTLSEASTVSAAFAGSAGADQYTVLYKLGQSMALAGRYADAIGAYEAALRAGAPDVPKQNPPRLHFQSAEMALRFDDPVTGARLGKQALAGVAGCGEQCADIVNGVHQIASFYHSIYGTSADLRYYAPALELYTAIVPVADPAKKTEVEGMIQRLEQTKKALATRKGAGVHDKGVVAALMGLHSQEVHVCYESILTARPKLTGTLLIELEIDQTGAVTGATSTPPAGDADLAAVARCAVARGKTWRLPTRGKPGITRVKLLYDLSRIGG